MTTLGGRPSQTPAAFDTGVRVVHFTARCPCGHPDAGWASIQVGKRTTTIVRRCDTCDDEETTDER